MDLLNGDELATLAAAREAILACIDRNMDRGEARSLAICGLLKNGADLLREIEALMLAERRLAGLAEYQPDDILEVPA